MAGRRRNGPVSIKQRATKKRTTRKAQAAHDRVAEIVLDRGGPRPAWAGAEEEDAVEILVDLRHYAEQTGFDFDEAVDYSRRLWKSER